MPPTHVSSPASRTASPQRAQNFDQSAFLKAVKGALSQQEEDDIADAVARWATKWDAPAGHTAGVKFRLAAAEHSNAAPQGIQHMGGALREVI